MRRKDRQVTEPSEIADILRNAKIVHLGMVDGARPYVVPLHYGFEWQGERLTLWCHGAKAGRKLDVIRANPQVFAEIDYNMELIDGGNTACQWGAYYASVMGEGTATIVEDVDEKVRGLRCLMRTQTGRDFDIAPQMTAAVAVLRIDIPEVTAKARKKMP